MKISNEEVNAANYELTRYVEGRGNIQAVTDALEAALRVRKARKAAKRAKRKPVDVDEMLRVHTGLDKQNHIDMYGGKVTQWPQKVKSEPDNRYANVHLGFQGICPTPKPLTFEAGKSYRTRDGQKETLCLLGDPLKGKYFGWAYEPCGDGRVWRDVEHQHDLIAPWED